MQLNRGIGMFGAPAAVLVGLLALGIQGTPQASEPPQLIAEGGPSVAVGVGGAIGSAAGLVGGAALGSLLAESFDIDQSGEDPGLVVALVGGLGGALLGAAIGAQVAGDVAEPERATGFGARLRDAAFGLLAAGAGAFIASRVSDDDWDETGVVVGWGQRPLLSRRSIASLT